MTPRDLRLRTIRGETVDRVPLELAGFEYPSLEAVAKIEDPLRREIAERVFAHSVVRRNHPSHTNRYLMIPPQRMRNERKPLPGGEWETTQYLDTPDGALTAIVHSDRKAQTSWNVTYPVETREGLRSIAAVPWERPPGLSAPDRDTLPADPDGRFLLSTSVSSPFVCVAGVMPYQMFLGLCATDLPWMEELTELCLERTLDCLDVLLQKPGIEYVWVGGSEWVTPPMASPQVYDALVQDQERRLIAFIKQRSEAVVHLHCHGRVRETILKVIERGADYLEPVEPPPDGDVTMAEAKALAAERLTLGGNLESRLMCYGTEAEVERATRAAFEGGKARFILRPTEGPSPTLSEREYRNWTRIIDVWEELSPM
ncbi:MAG: hypothetical protein COZ06_16945 [Armatimonadetes bacterium CG_4_10_14_3_um_filter_66_18]|nr:hypothetical protein [Armatimonadota bacterium]OIP04214.1 MAG: hypothetical protein AUJ96_13340 [Armatimonadetes bacterium CG2_30_66_41]PIX37294.1 MAG: hypothetical protein COZ57_35065 [Armatimonadetes bacterium CG_4_8_14_3_um_filter_66_20]PIY48244.1 MAG: hypothetical protein COZ06_16945 [Armatimonadetes bacterium CG_4_10_14_3_um_filter_66_18]PIZ47744.1 MAG: hypothetical protein COY42_07805 [Armatimonadetes bacterium CG_4_10_14_0_8_um_filter_66_14]PJB71133.1 MAG: hypothetical protein CO096_